MNTQRLPLTRIFCGLFILAALFCLTPYIMQAQTDTAAAAPRLNLDDLATDADKPLFMRYGLFAGYNFTTHNVNFALFQGCPSCATGNYGGQNGKMFNIGGLFEYPAFNRLGFGLRAGYMFTLKDGDFTNESYPFDFAMDAKGNFTGQSSWMSTTFRQQEKTKVSVNGQLEDGIFEQRMSLLLGILSIEPYITYRLADAFTLHLGAQVNIFLNKKYLYGEFIVSPKTAVFHYPDDTSKNGSYRGLRGIVTDSKGKYLDVVPETPGEELPFVKGFNASLMAGISYEIPLNPTGTILFAPEAFYIKALGSFVESNNNPDAGLGDNPTSLPANVKYVTKQKNAEGKTVYGDDGTWSFDNIRVGFSLRVSPWRTIRPEMTPELQDKVRQLKRYDSLVTEERKKNAQQLARVDSVNRAITAKVEELKKVGISVNITKVVGVDESGKEIPTPTLVIEQFRSQTVQPLLSQIYFDDNSFVLPSRYRRIRATDRNAFKMAEVAGKSNMEVYRHVLNIVGQRLTDNPAAVLFITGCNSGIGTEKDNIRLSEQRATAISDYLQDVWKIAPKRLVIQKQNLPDKPASINEATGQAENRRVELSSNLPEIFEAVKSDQITKLANPPTIRVGLEINAGAGLKQWDMEITQFVDNESQTVKAFNGTNNYPPQVDWNINREPNTMPQSGQDLSVQLTMTDINNKTGDAPIVSMPVQQVTVEKKELEGKADKRIDVYDVIGFDFGTNTVQLDESGQKLIETIKKGVKPNSTVIVTGYTDNTGDATKNKDLARRRAEYIARAIGAPNARINAVGPTTLFDNELPEGRAYNRYVHVEVQTPTR